jgi:SAM-dependent methyltransferase
MAVEPMSGAAEDGGGTPSRRTKDEQTIRGFGDEWSRFDQSGLSENELEAIWNRYFHIFRWDLLDADAEGIDVGCGTGRWARFVAPRVAGLTCVDPSDRALDVARRVLAGQDNCRFLGGAAGELPFPDGSFDFGYSVGVLHHTPEPLLALQDCVRILRPGSPFLLYLYYDFDNRASWFRVLWRVSDVIRRAVSRLPFRWRYAVTQILALFVYWPLARTARLLEAAGCAVSSFPLSFYREEPLYVMRNDALDRFGTRLESRFSREEIKQLMERADLEGVEFSDREPFWCAVGIKRSDDVREC